MFVSVRDSFSACVLVLESDWLGGLVFWGLYVFVD